VTESAKRRKKEGNIYLRQRQAAEKHLKKVEGQIERIKKDAEKLKDFVTMVEGTSRQSFRKGKVTSNPNRPHRPKVTEIIKKTRSPRKRLAQLGMSPKTPSRTNAAPRTPDGFPNGDFVPKTPPRSDA